MCHFNYLKLLLKQNVRERNAMSTLHLQILHPCSYERNSWTSWTIVPINLHTAHLRGDPIYLCSYKS